MSEITLNPELLKTLQNKVVVLTGGATGIGRAALQLFHDNGAKVVVGDVNDKAGEDAASSLGDSVRYVHCDVSSYADQLRLFDTAEKSFGRVDVVLANAGIVSYQNIFAKDADFTKEPSMKELDVNIKGVIYTARIGTAYLRKVGGGDIILTSSTAGFKPANDIPVYYASKHGVVGLMRGLYQRALEENIHINVVLPYTTRSQLSEGLTDVWLKAGLPWNEAEDVAKAMLISATANRAEGKDNHLGVVLPFAGKQLWIKGGEIIEFEDNLQRLEPQWLGERHSKDLNDSTDFVLKWFASMNEKNQE